MRENNISKYQAAIPAALIALVGIWVAYISYTQSPTEAFEFPRLVSTVFVVLSLWVFVKSILKPEGESIKIPTSLWLAVLPGLVVAFIYVFWAAKFFGFYVAATITVFILISLYDPASNRQVTSWVKRGIITVVFVAVMYMLFQVLLSVFTPRGLFF